MKVVLIVDLQNSKNTYLNFKFIVDESMTLAQNSIEMIIDFTQEVLILHRRSQSKRKPFVYFGPSCSRKGEIGVINIGYTVHASGQNYHS